MKLLTQAIIKKLQKFPLYSTDGQKEKEGLVKFFTPWAGWTWYVYEAEQQENGDWMFFGLVESPQCKELGYFSLAELASIKGPAGLKIERDRHYG